MLYVIFIFGGLAVMISLNIAFNSFLFALPIYQIVLFSCLSAAICFTIDAILALIIRRLPQKWFTHGNKFFNVSKSERNFLAGLGINKWKDKVVEWGFFTNFSKKRVSDPNSTEYLLRFILESNYGIIIHISNIFLGFLVILILPLKFWFCFSLFAATVNAFCHVLPLMILRFNNYRLAILLKRKTVNNSNVINVA